MIPQYMKPKIEVKLADPRLSPYRAHETDAGADLMSTKSLMIYPKGIDMVDTGVAVRIPPGYVGLVFSRSSQGKVRVSLANSVGVIDADYRGNIKLLITNDGEDPYEINAFTTKIAQLTIMPVMLANFVPFDGDEQSWNDTARGFGGFGSTNT